MSEEKVSRRPEQDQRAAIESLTRDLKTLESNRSTISRLILETLGGYESVLKRVKTAGDRTLANGAAEHLKTLAGIYRVLQKMGVFSSSEETFFKEYTQGLQEATNTLAVAQLKVAGLLRRTAKQQKILAVVKSRMDSLGKLEVDESSFFDSPDKRTAVRRARELDRKIRR